MSESSLRYFFEAARFGSMRAAAEKLGVAVSSVSRQIAQLELDMGVPLIEHGRRTIKLTEAGQLTVDYYRKQLGQREDFESRLNDLKSLRCGRIELAVDEGVAAAAMQAPLSNFMAKFAGLSLVVHSVAPNRLVQMVADDEVHLGIAFNLPPDPRLRVRASVPAPLCLVTARSHPLAHRFRVQLAELEGCQVILPQDAFEIGSLLKQAERQAGVTLRASLATNSLALIKSMVQMGPFVTILPSFAVMTDGLDDRLVSVPLVDGVPEGAISLFCRLGRQMPRAAGRLMALLESELGRWLDPEEKRRAG